MSYSSLTSPALTQLDEPLSFQKTLLDSTQRSLGREGLIRRIVEIENHSFDLRYILQATAKELCEFFQSDRCIVVCYDKNDPHYRDMLSGQYCKASDILPIREEDSPQRAPHLFSKKPLQQKNSLVYINASSPDEFPNYIKAFYERNQVQAALVVEIYYRGIPYGRLALQHCKTTRVWSEEDIQLLEIIATQVGIALYQAELYQKEQQAREEAETAKERYFVLYQWEKKTREIIQRIREPQSLDTLFTMLVAELGKALHVDRCFIIHFYEGKAQPLQYQYIKDKTVKSFQSLQVPVETYPLFQRCCEQQSLFFIPDVNTMEIPLDEKWKNWINTSQIRGFLGVPIYYQNELLYGLIFHTKQPRHWNTHEIEFISSVTDQLTVTISQAKVQQALETTSQLKSSFLANMSHELRTPLNAIIGYSEMLEAGMAGELGEKQSRYVHNVIVSGHHLLEMVNDILDLSKIEAGKTDLTLERFDLKPFVHNVIDIFQELAKRKQVTLFCEIEAGLPEIKADPARLRQIFFNLISNAIKFNREAGQVTIRVFRSEDKRKIITQVEDTGIGIPHSKVSELFSEFYQVDSSFARKEEGTGLGLALTKKLVELHHGEIFVTSKEGVGSTFTFCLPTTP